MIRGFATVDGTGEYARRFSHLSYSPLGRADLQVSAAGFGAYRVDSSVAEHRAALQSALLSGINLIDTSANYADGGSEKLIGEVLGELIGQGTIARDGVVIVSKGGYLQGGNYRRSQARKAAGQPFPELVEYAHGLEHCIHPDFLAEQIKDSLERLQVETIDCYLLHNPEYYLKYAEEQGMNCTAARTEYLRRIETAFRHLETEAAAGRIGWYGISSNTFVLSEDDYAFTSLAQVWELAEGISPAHHFAVIEFPWNLFETGAVTEANQPGGASLIEVARDVGLGVLVNRPLNAIRDNDLIRLADNVYDGQAALSAAAFRRQVAAIDSDWQDADTLSHLALRALRSTLGVTAVLVGMRHTDYVADIIQELRSACTPAERRAVWEKVKEITAAR